jgi:hypothetical protein
MTVCLCIQTQKPLFAQNRKSIPAQILFSPHHYAQTNFEFHSVSYKWVKQVNVKGNGETGVNLSQSRDSNSGFSETETQRSKYCWTKEKHEVQRE